MLSLPLFLMLAATPALAADPRTLVRPEQGLWETTELSYTSEGCGRFEVNHRTQPWLLTWTSRRSFWADGTAYTFAGSTLWAEPTTNVLETPFGGTVAITTSPVQSATMVTNKRLEEAHELELHCLDDCSPLEEIIGVSLPCSVTFTTVSVWFGDGEATHPK